MTVKPETVDDYLLAGCGRCSLGGTPECKVHRWSAELLLLRALLLETDLTEEIKWGAPCYTLGGKNVIILGALKGNVSLSFFRGHELDDATGLLEKSGENSQIARVMRFHDVASITTQKQTILAFIQQAIALEASGKAKPVVKAVEMPYPEELLQICETHPEFEEAFSALTPGRQRGYLIYFSSAKQSKTRQARIQKCMPKIFEGKGWNEY
ncbi:DUF1801 domain-containing protein [Kiritimatiellota bacterium B12222]|nr:DUF1801 domain-containing protein [Kiritimatiellota bacterium B12222]